MFLPLFPLVASYASEKAMCLGRCYIGGSDVSSIPRSLRRPQLRLLVPNNVTGTTPVLSASSHIHHVDEWALGSRGQRPTASFPCLFSVSSQCYVWKARQRRSPSSRTASSVSPARQVSSSRTGTMVYASGRGLPSSLPQSCHHPAAPIHYFCKKSKHIMTITMIHHVWPTLQHYRQTAGK